MINARNIFTKKKEIEDIFKNMIKKESPPKTEPKKSLILDTFLFKIIDIPSKRIKSNKKFIKKT